MLTSSLFVFYAYVMDAFKVFYGGDAAESGEFAPLPKDDGTDGGMHLCDRCGAPTLSQTCGYCRMKAKTIERENP